MEASGSYLLWCGNRFRKERPRYSTQQWFTPIAVCYIICTGKNVETAVKGAPGKMGIEDGALYAGTFGAFLRLKMV